jgi:ABC-type multidrug transport system ATPase subunit
LLNILAGRAATRGRIKIDADIRLNNYDVDPTNVIVRQQIAFVAQDDSLQVTSTPREAIRFSAKLRLPRYMTDKQIDKLTIRMLTELGLDDCADTIVGGALIKGISGGQRKRTSVGVELVTKPALVFLDEPTSGLDSFSAVQLCQVLKKVANAGSSVLFTIHQPSSEIFNSFDHLILMNKGRVMYQGAVAAVPEYFGARNHPNPPNYNPADWIMNVAQSVELRQLDADGFFPEDEREVQEAFEGDKTGHDVLGLTTHSVDNSVDTRSVGFTTELRWLFHREVVNFRRDTTALGSKFGLTLFLGILIGVIFLGVGATDPSLPTNVNSRFGGLVICLMMGMFGTAQDALLGFPTERPVFLREYSTNHYSVVSYFMSRLTMEAVVTLAQIFVLTITTYFMIDFQLDYLNFFFITYALSMASTAMAVLLGCSVEDPKLASEMLPLLFVPQMLFAGFFVATDLIPSWLRWAQYLCSLTYAVRLVVIEEFSNCSGPGTQNCLDTISRIDANPDEAYWYWLVLIGLFLFFRIFALMVLRKKASKFY